VKSSLRTRYVGWILVLMSLLFLFQLVAFTAYEINEWREWGTMEHVKEDVKELLVLLGIDVVVLPFILLVSWAVSGKMIAPLHSVAATARRISSGNLSERVAYPSTQDEIGSLVHTINGAFDKYQDALKRLQRFTSDASHQLRTPLAALRSVGEVCLQQDRAAAEYRDTLGAMLEEVDRLSTIVEKLLLLARLERTQVRGQFRPVDLARLADEVVQAFLVFSQDKGIAMALEADARVMVEGDADLLHQVVANLVDNAIRYTPTGGTIQLQVQAYGDKVRLAVADSGPGIPEEYRQRVFERFSRGPAAVGSGSGLGLAIVGEIVRIHGGAVDVGASAQGGAEFRVTLPRAAG
jgi:heavy metal sensor kinase